MRIKTISLLDWFIIISLVAVQLPLLDMFLPPIWTRFFSPLVRGYWWVIFWVMVGRFTNRLIRA